MGRGKAGDSWILQAESGEVADIPASDIITGCQPQPILVRYVQQSMSYCDYCTMTGVSDAPALGNTVYRRVLLCWAHIHTFLIAMLQGR